MKTRHLVYLAFALLGLGLAGLLEDWGLLPQSPSLLSLNRLYLAHAKGLDVSGTRVVYVSPLKALAVDIAENLERPLAEIAETTYGGRRLIVRRVRELSDQQELSPDWRHHPFITNRHDLLREVKAELGQRAARYNFSAYSDAKALFKHEMHTLPDEIGVHGAGWRR